MATPKKIGHTDAFSFAFVEFSNEEECVSAKTELTQKRLVTFSCFLSFYAFLAASPLASSGCALFDIRRASPLPNM